MDLAAHRMSPLHRVPDRNLNGSVLLRLPRGRVLTMKSGEGAVVLPHIVHVGEELQRERGASDLLFIPHAHINLEAMSTNMVSETDGPMDASLGPQRSM